LEDATAVLKGVDGTSFQITVDMEEPAAAEKTSVATSDDAAVNIPRGGDCPGGFGLRLPQLVKLVGER